MGKQDKSRETARQRAREEKELTRDFSSLMAAVKRGDIEVVDPSAPPKTPVRIILAAEPSPSAARPAETAPAKPTAPAAPAVPPPAPETPATTLAPATKPAPVPEAKTAPTPPAPQVEEEGAELHSGSREQYQSYFALCVSLPHYSPLTQVIDKGGWYCLERDFIPGPAYKLHFGSNGRVRLFAATFDVDIETPTGWLKQDDLPLEVKEALARRLSLIKGLSAEPTPWVTKRALDLLNGKGLPGDLVMGFSFFEWRNREVLFGLIYSPAGNKVRVKRVYNPTNLADVPKEGEILSMEDIRRGGKAPHHKLVRIWAKMEIAAAVAQRELRALRQKAATAQPA